MKGWEKFKKRMFEIVEASKSDNDIASKAYDATMLVAVIVGLIPLTLKGTTHYTNLIDIVTSIIFLIDYIIRLWTADYKMGIKMYKAYIAYILSPMAIIDLLSIVPVLYIFFPQIHILKYFRIIRIARLLKLLRYSSSIVIIENIFRRIKNKLLTVLALVTAYIVACAMLIFQIEPDLFNNFWDAIYWATMSITTIGYGDIAPVTTAGRMLAVVSSLVGIGVIALPSALLTAAYMDEIKKKKGKHEL